MRGGHKVFPHVVRMAMWGEICKVTSCPPHVESPHIHARWMWGDFSHAYWKWPCEVRFAKSPHVHMRQLCHLAPMQGKIYKVTSCGHESTLPKVTSHPSHVESPHIHVRWLLWNEMLLQQCPNLKWWRFQEILFIHFWQSHLTSMRGDFTPKSPHVDARKTYPQCHLMCTLCGCEVTTLEWDLTLVVSKTSNDEDFQKFYWWLVRGYLIDGMGGGEFFHARWQDIIFAWRGAHEVGMRWDCCMRWEWSCEVTFAWWQGQLDMRACEVTFLTHGENGHTGWLCAVAGTTRHEGMWGGHEATFPTRGENGHMKWDLQSHLAWPWSHEVRAI